MKKDLKNSIRNLKRNKDYVGADDPVRPIQKRNTQRGITLVALIITIIVLLILAIVSIKIAIDGGLITKAKDAKDTHTIGAEKEAIQLGYSTYQMDLAKKGSATLTVEGSSFITPTSDGGWDIAFKVNNYHLDKNGNITEGNGQDTKVPTEDLEYLKKELLGEDGKGKQVSDIATFSGSWYYYNTIEFNDKNIKSLNVCDSGYNDNSLVIEYNDSVYILKFSYYDVTESLKFIYKKNKDSKEGKKVDYSYDDTEANKKEWTVLYDYGDTLEIVSPEAIGELALGKDDAQAQGNDDIEKTIYSYNHAIERINNYTASLVTNPNKISVRSVGSNPSNPNNRNEIKYDWNGNESANGFFEGTDNNREYDIARMSYFNIAGANKRYWSASRKLKNLNQIIVYTYETNGLGNGDTYLAYGSKENRKNFTQSYAVRPVVKVNASSVQIKD